MKKKFETLVTLACVAVFGWFTLSYAEVMAKHENTNVSYSEYNVFSLMENAMNKQQTPKLSMKFNRNFTMRKQMLNKASVFYLHFVHK